MTDEEINKKADIYAKKHSFRVSYDGSNNFYYDKDYKCSLEGFKEGATWVLENQWEDAIKELPKINQDVILYSEGLYFHCRFKDNKFIIIDKFPDGVDGNFIYSSGTYDPNIVIDYWMPIPKLKESEEKK